MSLQMRFPATLDGAAWATAAVKGISTLWNLSEIRAYQLELAVAEATNNAGLYSEGWAELHLELSDGRLHCQVFSQGPELPPDVLSRARQAVEFEPNDLENLNESGRGFYLLQELTDELELARRDERNVLRFWFGLTDPELSTGLDGS